MKKRVFSVMFVLFIAVTMTGCQDEEILPDSKIPNEITGYVSTYFPDCTITKITREKGAKDDMYEVSLSCGFELEFSKDLKVTEIKGKTQIPDMTIPEKLLDYVRVNYPGNFIIEWELEGKNQKMKLNDRTKLVFNNDGDFLRTDD